VGLVLGLASWIFSWLVGAESSPLHHYFLFHTTLPNLWGAINIIPVVIAFIVAFPIGAVGHGGFEPVAVFIGFILMFVFWFMIGFLLTGLFGRILDARRAPLATNLVR